MFSQIVKRTLRVPALEGVGGNGVPVARQLDVALMKAGYKLSGELLAHLSAKHPSAVKETGQQVLAAVRELVGDHVAHNTYFLEFPEGVPDTVEFWLTCIADALSNPHSAPIVALELSFGMVNLLDLPKYGSYQHSYEEMVAAHTQFVPSLKDRLTILHLGGTLPEETLRLYHQLAGSPVPANETDLALLKELAEVCLADPQPEKIPVRENKALINQVRLENGAEVLADTVTDLLRLATALSGGDVTLETPTKFKSIRRPVRRALLAALDTVVGKDPAKLADVNQYREPWKRLGERLHPHEFGQFTNAAEVFAVARGDKTVRSLAAKVEIALSGGNTSEAITILAKAPGMLVRNLDRLLRSASEDEIDQLLETLSAVLGKVSGRVILSVREQLQNRLTPGNARIFANSKGKAWVMPDERAPLPEAATRQLLQLLDEEIVRRLPEVGSITAAPEALNLALPLSGKNQAAGYAVMPRGSIQAVEGEILRFFVYWKQHHERTDYDLSVLLLDENFQQAGWVSYTRLRDEQGYSLHSGDITSAPGGASEFIDIDLSRIQAAYVVPQVNVYSGEGFAEVEEAFFGFMTRERSQWGLPFEARTVRMKSDLRGNKGKVALPIAFARTANGGWEAKWLGLFLNGSPSMNRVEANKLSTSLLAQTVFARQYLTIGYLAALWQRKAGLGEAMYVGIEAPEGLPEGTKVYSLANLTALIPA